MTINRTTLLDLPLPVTGTESGTWGDIVNNGLSEYIDISVAGSLSLSADSDTNLSSTEGNAVGTNIGSTTAQYAILRCTGARTATRNINAPAWAISGGTLTNYSKIYIVVNETTGSQNIVLRATNSATPTYTTGVTIVPGERAVCAWNGSDFVKVGGAAGGSTTQIQFNNAGVFGGSANLTWDGTNVQIGATGALRLADTDSSNYVAFKSPGTVASNVTWTLPSADGSANQAIVTNGSGTLSFATISTAAATPTTLGTVYGSTNVSQRTAIGFEALNAASGTYNQAFGYQAGRSTTGDQNSFFGWVSGYTNTTGASNAAFGNASLYTNSTGSNNSAFGQGALQSNTTASGNTAVGYQAGNANQTNSYFVAIGYQAALNNKADDSVYIGAFAGQANTTGAFNHAVGFAALYPNTTGSYNTAFGYASLRLNTTGSNNVAVGHQALNQSTTANNNTAIGYQALYNNTTAISNTAVGYQAGYTSNATAAPSNVGANVFIGSAAGYSATSAIHSVIIGAGAGYNVNTGSSNTLVGRIAGYNLTSGTFNTFVGPGDNNGGSGAFVSTGGKNTILGAYNGNQDGLDIRTASNYAVISDGDGNRLLSTANGYSLALDGGAVPQSGTGITFPATQSASTDANTLDDYEEGTWTPTLTGASSDPTVTYTTQLGQYTKVGRVVHVQCNIVPATYSGGSGVLRIAGLPFTSGSSTFYVTGSAYLEGVDIGASRTWATSYVAPGVSYIRVITSQNNGAASDVLVGGVSAGDNFIIGITYMV